MIETSNMPGAPASPGGSGITFRAWRGFDDLPGVTAVNDAVRRRAGLLEPVDLEDMRHSYTNMRNCDADVDLLLAERADDVVADARAAWEVMTDGTRLHAFTVLVQPEAAGLGLGEAFVAGAATRAAAQAAAHPTDRPAQIGAYAYAEDEELAGALTEAGYGAVHWSAEMLREDPRAFVAGAVQ